jgi:hypothetical protein
MPNNLPQHWLEVFVHPDCNDPPGMANLQAAYALLRATYPEDPADPNHRLSFKEMMRKMIPRKIGAYYLMNLRVFLRRENGNSNMAAFFFLRKRFQPMAFCLSPAALDNVDSQFLHDELVKMGQWMQVQPNHPPAEVVSVSNPPDFPNNQNLDEAFDIAVNREGTLAYRGTIMPGDPWPDLLFRWEFTR